MVFKKFFFPAAFILCLTILSFKTVAQNYFLNIKVAGKDSSFKVAVLGIQTTFINKTSAEEYIPKIPVILAAKGFAAASVDSVYYDAVSAFVQLYLGDKFSFADVNIDNLPENLLSYFHLSKKNFSGLTFEELAVQQQKILNYYENNGYPFAEVSLQNILIEQNKIKANLQINKGPEYHIDSIRVYGNTKINNRFLQHYLAIQNRSLYNKQKLQNISQRLRELPYLLEQQPRDITMLGSGAVVNLYLQPKRSSQINVLIGILPATQAGTKTQITGDVNLNLKNALSNGETIAVMWQKLQKQSPKLSLGYQQPYIFNSNFGVDLSFDLYKKDSAFVQVNGLAGIQYLFSTHQSAKIFFQLQQNILLEGGYDTNQIRVSKQLPQNIDVSSSNFGVDYSFINTDYKFNPRRGNEFNVTASAGIRKIRKNNDITSLKDPSSPGFNYSSLYDLAGNKNYQFNVKLQGAHYISSGKSSVLKLALNGAVFYSPSIFKNELYRIGGYKLLRGFDEESILVNQYAVATAEFRYLTGLNSFLYLFSDAAITQSHFQSNDFSNQFLSAGIGLSFETKVGLLNISYAAGARNDLEFNLKQASKIHFGYINYF